MGYHDADNTPRAVSSSRPRWELHRRLSPKRNAQMRVVAAREIAPANPSSAKYFIKAVMIESPIGGLAVAMPEARKIGLKGSLNYHDSIRSKGGDPGRQARGGGKAMSRSRLLKLSCIEATAFLRTVRSHRWN